MPNPVYQITISAGTGPLTLSHSGGRSFHAVFGTGGSDMFFYAITHLVAAEWEVGTGHLRDAATLVRDTVMASSNGDAPVDFSPGRKDVVNAIRANMHI